MGTTVGDVIISYDINRYHTDVKNAMINLGYRTQWNYPEKPSYQLPNTTLLNTNKSSDQAMADLNNIFAKVFNSILWLEIINSSLLIYDTIII
ncbi:hypothetical protein Aeqsu_3099 [Aequorivita sublithincola DSM 14238]|uniref:Uncharacterized protein n=1 Tax=Aequorivita sublithincola (strain DSM 14238 / LMG 21431 / ACAM 643 / 9-3) TaxID=746697 RepID=I3YZW7_AEQSU|nr:hypothetical protein [Aequorivita sublithincola]AFL82535.1 hypothetical protein Aeqsu_3099 [Aequorivita sublithincola DSM 14238]